MDRAAAQESSSAASDENWWWVAADLFGELIPESVWLLGMVALVLLMVGAFLRSYLTVSIERHYRHLGSSRNAAGCSGFSVSLDTIGCTRLLDSARGRLFAPLPLRSEIPKLSDFLLNRSAFGCAAAHSTPLFRSVAPGRLFIRESRCFFFRRSALAC